MTEPSQKRAVGGLLYRSLAVTVNARRRYVVSTSWQSVKVESS